MGKYKKAAPRSEIRREMLRALNVLDHALNHFARAAAWAEEGKRPDIAEYISQMAQGVYMLQQTVRRFMSEVLGYATEAPQVPPEAKGEGG